VDRLHDAEMATGIGLFLNMAREMLVPHPVMGVTILSNSSGEFIFCITLGFRNTFIGYVDRRE